MHCLPTDKFLLNNVHGKHIWQHFFKCTLKWQITHHFSKIAQQQQQHLQQQQLQQQSCGAKLGATVAVAAKLACRDVWPEPHVIMASVCAGKVCNAGFLTDMINDHSTLTYFLCKCKISLIKLYIVVFFSSSWNLWMLNVEIWEMVHCIVRGVDLYTESLISLYHLWSKRVFTSSSVTRLYFGI